MSSYKAGPPFMTVFVSDSIETLTTGKLMKYVFYLVSIKTVSLINYYWGNQGLQCKIHSKYVDPCKVLKIWNPSANPSLKSWQIKLPSIVNSSDFLSKVRPDQTIRFFDWSNWSKHIRTSIDIEKENKVEQMQWSKVRPHNWEPCSQCDKGSGREANFSRRIGNNKLNK